MHERGIPHGGRSDVGMRREHNEDAMLVAEPLFAVADGVGGSARGEVASSRALDALATHADSIVAAPGTQDAVRAMEQAVLAANAAVHEAQVRDETLRGMATTLTAYVIRPGGEVIVGHVGDSRLYVVSAAGARQVTNDHSVVGELLRGGRIDAAAAAQHPQRNVITRALGPEDDVSVDAFVVYVGPGDWLLACSDGLSEHVADEEFARLLVDAAVGVDEILEQLVELANARGGTDNITIVAAQPIPSDVSGELRIEAIDAAREAAGPVEPVEPSPVEASGELPVLQPITQAARSRESDNVAIRWWRRAWIRWAVAGLLIAASTVLLWSRSYFLLEREDGRVGINRGFPIARLAVPYRSSGVVAEELPPADRRELVESHTLRDREEAEQVLDQLAEQVDDPVMAVQP